MRKSLLHRGFCVLMITPLVLLASCDRAQPIHIAGATQGTTYHVTLVDTNAKANADAVQQQLEARLARIDASLSNYRDDSTLSRFNRAPAATWIELDDDLAAVLRYSQQLSAESDGAFDVTVAPLVELWGFGRQKTEVVPTAAHIETARSAVDYRRLEIDPTQPRARKQQALTIDVNGIAQGYTVDRLADLLRAAGYRNYLVEVGGELRAIGHNARGEPWRIAIEQPDEAASPSAVELGGSGAADPGTIASGITTAGDYHDYFEQDGVRYSHTIDPRTGRPIAHKLASVTVIAATAFIADGLDTVLEVLGPDAGFAYAEQRNIAAYFMVRGDRGFVVRYTTAMAPYLSSKK